MLKNPNKPSERERIAAATEVVKNCPCITADHIRSLNGFIELSEITPVIREINFLMMNFLESEDCEFYQGSEIRKKARPLAQLISMLSELEELKEKRDD